MNKTKILLGLFFILFFILNCTLSIYTPYVTVKKDKEISKSFTVNNVKTRYTIVAISAQNSFDVNTTIEPIISEDNFKFYTFEQEGIYSFRVLNSQNASLDDLLVYCPAEKILDEKKLEEFAYVVKGYFISSNEAKNRINEYLSKVTDLDSFIDVLVYNKMLYDLDKDAFVNDFNAFNPEIGLLNASNILNEASRYMEVNQYNFTKLYKKDEEITGDPYEIIKIYNENIYKLLANKMKNLSFDELYDFSKKNKLSIEFIIQNPYVKFRKKFIEEVAEDKITGMKFFLNKAKDDKRMIDAFFEKSRYTYEIIVNKINADWTEDKPSKETRLELKYLKEKEFPEILQQDRFKELFLVIDNFSQKKWHLKVKEQISFEDFSWIKNLNVLNTLKTKPEQKAKFYPIFDTKFEAYFKKNVSNFTKGRIDTLISLITTLDVDNKLKNENSNSFKKRLIEEVKSLEIVERKLLNSMKLKIPGSYNALTEQLNTVDDYFLTLGEAIDYISKETPEPKILAGSKYYKYINNELKPQVIEKFNGWETEMVIPLTVYLNKQKKVNNLDQVYQNFLKLGNASVFFQRKELNTDNYQLGKEYENIKNQMSKKLAQTYEQALKSQPNSAQELTELVINLGRFNSSYLKQVNNRVEKKIRAKLLNVDQIKTKERRIQPLLGFERFYLQRISRNRNLIAQIEENKEMINLRNDFLSENPKKITMEDVGLEYENSFNWLVDNWKEYSLDFIQMVHDVRKRILSVYEPIMSKEEIANLKIGNSISFDEVITKPITLEKQTSAVFTNRQNIFTVNLPKRSKLTINEVILEFNGEKIDDIDKLIIGYLDKGNKFKGIYSTRDSGANTMAITYPPPMADAMNKNPLNSVDKIVYKIETDTNNKINVNQVKFLIKFNEEK